MNNTNLKQCVPTPIEKAVQVYEHLVDGLVGNPEITRSDLMHDIMQKTQGFIHPQLVSDILDKHNV